MAELEDRLRAVEVAWPQTPDVAARVVARVERGGSPSHPRRSGERGGSAARRRRPFARRPRFALVLALALLAVFLFLG